MTFAHLLQSLSAAGFFAALCVVLDHVRKTTISDKYGVAWVMYLIGFLWVNLSRDWFSLVSLEVGALVFAAVMGFISLGILFSVRFTEYSRIRRVSIQEVALLRYRYQELFKKLETPDDLRQTPQTY